MSFIFVIHFICVKGHTSYSACHKCTVEGQMCGHRMYFPYSTDTQERTDELFCAGKYPDHIIRPTPLSDMINCHMIMDFVLDCMHLMIKECWQEKWTYGLTAIQK